MNKSFVILTALMLLAGALAADLPETPAPKQLVVSAMDLQRHVLRTGLGFVWDENTLFCSLQLVKDAAFVRVQGDDASFDLDRVVSYSRYFDVVVLHSDAELPMAGMLGSSDTTGKGDSVQVFVPDSNNRWLTKQIAVKSWDDPGKGYLLLTTDSPGSTFQSGPVLNREGMTIGWMFQPGETVPNRNLDRFVSGQTGTVSLKELNSITPMWETVQPSDKNIPELRLSEEELRMVRGTVRFPFRISFPKNWKNQIEARETQFVIRTAPESKNVFLELRVMPQSNPDLLSSIDSAERLLFSGMARCNFAPYSAKHVCGFLACYDNPDPSSRSAVQAFFGMMGSNLYVLTITYPGTWEDQVRPFLEKTLDSLEM